MEKQNTGTNAPDVKAAFEKYSDMVYRLAFARMKNRYDAEDILQEVFLRYLKMKSPPETEEHTKALLITTTINCTKSKFTFMKRKRTFELNDSIATYIPNGDTLDAVLRLPIKYRTVIHLHYYCGYSIDEIAFWLHLKPSTAKSWLFRARKMLKAELKEEDLVVY